MASENEIGFTEKLYAIPGVSDQIDLVLETFDDLYYAGKFAEANELLTKVELNRVHSATLITLLIVASWARPSSLLPCRVDLVQRIRETLALSHTPAEVVELMRGLGE